MVRYSRVRVGSRIVLLLLVVLVLFFGGLWWFDYLNLLDAKDFFTPVFRLVGLKTTTPIADRDSPTLLGDERIEKQREGLLIWQEELENQSASLEKKAAEVDQMLAAIQEEKTAFEEEKKSFNESIKLYEDKNKRLRQVSTYLMGMSVEGAVAQLENMEDQDIIDLFRITDVIAEENEQLSFVSVWLMNMDPQRAAAIQRKMIKKPTDPLALQ